ncbi:B-cell lymphoma 3 protein [Gopherus flavomarginatus]|uniref:B-cell lymphoma 3 protein n=1 Tax=Gopherus flavomarginatus TaxID=286002 RepID=UPI0021CBCCF7|nr:B-cell lymphoma 3 protein [Gopherus flavomarginatus]
MAEEMPVDLRTWRKGDSPECQGSRVPRTKDPGGQRAPQGSRPFPAPWPGASGGPKTPPTHPGASSPGPPDEGGRKAETSLPLRKRRYAVQGPGWERPGPPAGKVPKTESDGGQEGASGGQHPPFCNGYCPPYVAVEYSRLPAPYLIGLTGPFLVPERAPFFHPVAPHPLLPAPLLGRPATPYPLLCPLQTQMAADIATATKQDEDGDTALHIAVAQGNLPIAQRLVSLFLQGQRDLDIYNNLRQTPLHLAVITTQPSLVKLLLSHGASPMALDRHGQTSVHLACEHGSPRCLRELLEWGSSRPDLEARNYEGLTPLHISVATSNRDMVLLLLEHGADIDAVDIKSGRSPLLHAVENNSLDMVELLIQNGANVNAQSYAGCTALHVASGRGLLDALRLLVRNGADCGIKNYHNDTALMVAKNRRVIDILRGKASRPPPASDCTRDGASPAPSSASSPGARLTPNGLPSASPGSPPSAPSPPHTPGACRTAPTNQRPETAEPANGSSMPGPLHGVKLEGNMLTPTLRQPMGSATAPKPFLRLAESLLEPALHGSIYPTASPGLDTSTNHLSLVPGAFHPSIVQGLPPNRIHLRGAGLDQSRTLCGAGSPPVGAAEGQWLCSRDSGGS